MWNSTPDKEGRQEGDTMDVRERRPDFRRRRGRRLYCRVAQAKPRWFLAIIYDEAISASPAIFAHSHD